MSMFFVSLSTYLILLQERNNIGIWFYIAITLSVITGTLTHYYCLLFNIIISVVYCLYLLRKKRWKEVLIYSLCMTVAAGITIGIFPAIIRHLFKTEHAIDAFTGVRDFSHYLSRIVTCINILSNMLYGKLLILVVVAIIAMLFINKGMELTKDYYLVLIPSVLFFILISITATYTTERYLMPIYANLFCVTMCMFYVLLNKTIKEDRNVRIVSLSVLVIMTVLGYYKAEWEYLYREDAEHLRKAALHPEANCICIHEDLDKGWEIQLNFNEYIKYKSFILFGKDDLDLDRISDYIDGDEVIINLVCIRDMNSYLEEIKEALPAFKNHEYIGQKGNNYSYCFYK